MLTNHWEAAGAAGPGEAGAGEVAQAYDALAADYDGLVQEDFWMRRVLRDRFLTLFSAGDRVLDVACGTGLETLFLARCGLRVTGFDISARAVERLRSKAIAQGLTECVETRVHDATLPLPWEAESFEGVVSTFAGLNTVDAIEAFSAEAGRILKPRGRLLVHMVAPCGIWAVLPLIARLRWTEARALIRRRRLMQDIAGREIEHQVLPAIEVYQRFFRPHFRLERAYALGFLWPQGFGRWLPAALAHRLGRVEVYLGRLKIFLNYGRFFVLEMERKEPLQRGAR